MKIEMLLSAILLLTLLTLANQTCAVSSQKDEKKELVVQSEESKDEKVWIPESIEKCLSQAAVGESLAVATFINPFYLRADFDGNDAIDYAVLVQGEKTKKRGLLICKDARETFVFGPLAKLKTPASSFEDDNFITHRWEILTKKETENIYLNLGKTKLGANAKGESVAFMFEGGSIFIYWDGKTFRVVEGA